jgi:hypothetical protein
LIFNTPILILAFNRPETTAEMFKVLKVLKPKKLYISIDGPRENVASDLQNQLKVIELLKPDWECNLKTKISKINLGCSEGPSSAIKWFFEEEEQGIILEDDCIAELDFFYYCQELLERYKYDNRIFNICGSNLGFHPNIKEDYFESKFMNMSGWATWKRSAESIDYQLLSWINSKNIYYKLYKALRYTLIDFHFSWILFWRGKIRETTSGKKISWWDYQWILSQIHMSQVSIIPKTNLVMNIGFDENATHTKAIDHPIAFLPTNKINWPLKHPEKLVLIREYEENYVKGKWLNQARGKFRKLLIRCIKNSIRDLLINLRLYKIK